MAFPGYSTNFSMGEIVFIDNIMNIGYLNILKANLKKKSATNVSHVIRK